MSLIINAIAGGVIGVLINYLADVLPTTRRLTRPACRNCSQPYSLRNYLISFKCSNCGIGPSLRSILVLVTTILICILLGLFPFSVLSFWATLPILLFLGVIFVIDVEHHVVLIESSIIGIVLFFAYGFLIHGLLRTVIGGSAGFLIMLLLYYLGVAFTKIAGKLRHQQIDEVALGFGDVYVCAFLGLLTGWPTIAGTIIIAILASGAFSLFLIISLVISRKYRAFSAIPYAPFLILGAIATFYIG
jgi:hypothetical protein